MNITEEQFIEILQRDGNTVFEEKVDKTLEGLKIISKYTDDVIQGADHDVIYSEEIMVLIDAGITVAEVEQLNTFGWFASDDETYLETYV